jgi:hypothetical protein
VVEGDACLSDLIQGFLGERSEIASDHPSFHPRGLARLPIINWKVTVLLRRDNKNVLMS